MLFPSGTLVKTIERAEASLVEAFARAVEAKRGTAHVYISRLGSGIAVYAGEGSPFNKIAGAGFEVTDELALEEIERQYSSRGLPLRAEVATLADPEFLKRLASRGYMLSGFENVLGLDLAEAQLPRVADGVAVRRVHEHEDATWIDTVLTGFLTPDEFDGPPPTETFERDLLHDVFTTASTVGGVQKYLALRDGVVAGGASMRLDGGVAQLSGASTLPPHRRRGVQTSLLAARLADARAAGCTIAVVTTEPGSKSQQNVQRQGFALLYARAVMVRG